MNRSIGETRYFVILLLILIIAAMVSERNADQRQAKVIDVVSSHTTEGTAQCQTMTPQPD